jgi:putative FmdB family regulatory protein
MPTYEFKCESCGHQFEAQTKMDDPPPTCPYVHVGPDSSQVCGGPTRRLISQTTFILKGGGWANDGYGGGSR